MIGDVQFDGLVLQLTIVNDSLKEISMLLAKNLEASNQILERLEKKEGNDGVF